MFDAGKRSAFPVVTSAGVREYGLSKLEAGALEVAGHLIAQSSVLGELGLGNRQNVEAIAERVAEVSVVVARKVLEKTGRA